MLKISIDFEKTGLETFLKDYEADILKYLISNPNKQSKAVYDYLRDNIIGYTKSRATIINTLNDMLDWGLLEHIEATGKGGTRKVYSINSELNIKNTDDIARYILNRIVEASGVE